MRFSDEQIAAAKKLLHLCQQSGRMVATAESCTGGSLAALLTELPGSSAMLERGFITYANEAKIEMLGVPAEFIAMHGAVSAEVAAAMAKGALDHSRADVSVSITGIAGPGGGTTEKPVGTVFMAGATRNSAPFVERHLFEGDRNTVRTASVSAALQILERLV